jgi:hypothetical protein
MGREEGRGRRTGALRSLVVTIAAAVAACVNATAGDERGPWPDSRVAALWPTFASLPARATGAGGAPAWDGSFSRCVASPRVSYAYACEYRDESGELGYACLAATAPDAAITPRSINARVAPGDPTYAAEPPTDVCYSALAYSLSLG